MAVDQTQVALNLMSRLAIASEKVMSGLEEIHRIKNQKESAGVDFTATGMDAVLVASSLKHASGDNFNSVITSGEATVTFLETGFHDDVFDKVRSGGVS